MGFFTRQTPLGPSAPQKWLFCCPLCQHISIAIFGSQYTCFLVTYFCCLLALLIVVPVSFQFDDNILLLLCLGCARLESFCMIETSFTLLYSWDLLPSARFLQLYLLMTLKHHSKQLHTMLYTDIYNVVLRGVLALVVFADDSSDVN